MNNETNDVKPNHYTFPQALRALFTYPEKFRTTFQRTEVTSINFTIHPMVAAATAGQNLSRKLYVLALCSIIAVAGCSAASQSSTQTTAEDPAPIEQSLEETESTSEVDATDSAEELNRLKVEALTTYAEIVYASYVDSADLATKLQDAINEFVANPSPETHQLAKDAWLAAQEPYGQTEAYRFYGGPIDDENGPEGLMNAWPLDEAYIDYVQGAEESGIINNIDAYPTIDVDLLISLNEIGSEKNISTGYHAIEFLLWGQDFSDSGPGERKYTDYVVDGGTALHAERRGQYLSALAELLVDNLNFLVDEWASNQSDNYRAQLLATDPNKALQLVLTGIGVLSRSELAGERMFTAYDNQDREDEHSCFSDNTHRDIVTNALGIRNVYLGTYTRPNGEIVSGPSIANVVEQLAPDLNANMIALSDEIMAQVNNLSIPFEQAIINPNDRTAVLETVFTLQDQGDKIAEIGSLFGLSINTALPD